MKVKKELGYESPTIVVEECCVVNVMSASGLEGMDANDVIQDAPDFGL